MTIYLTKVCAIKGCTSQSRDGMDTCVSCERSTKPRTAINYTKVHRRLTEYLLNNWSRGRITSLTSKDD